MICKTSLRALIYFLLAYYFDFKLTSLVNNQEKTSTDKYRVDFELLTYALDKVNSIDKKSEQSPQIAGKL